jgi:cobalt/nickel transport system permease protein
LTVHIHFLDPYRLQVSPIHSLDARVKFVLTLAFIFTVALTPPGAWAVYILLFSLVLCVEILSALGVVYVLKRSALALSFILAAFPVIFTLNQGNVLFSLPIGAWMLTAYQGGVERFISIGLKSWISVQMAIVLASTTPFPELLVAVRAVKMPRLLVAVFGLMWRYLFVLADEALRLMRARASRSGQSGVVGLRSGGKLAWRAKVTGGMAGSLFLRGIERSDRIYNAMLARGYDGEIRTLPLPGLGASNWLMLLACLALLAALLGLAYLLT